MDQKKQVSEIGRLFGASVDQDGENRGNMVSSHTHKIVATYHRSTYIHVHENITLDLLYLIPAQGAKMHLFLDYIQAQLLALC